MTVIVVSAGPAPADAQPLHSVLRQRTAAAPHDAELAVTATTVLTDPQPPQYLGRRLEKSRVAAPFSLRIFSVDIGNALV
jgi:hypothetical protein